MIRIRVYEPGDEDAVLALWEAAGLARPWLDLRAEIHEKLKRDPDLFLVAVESDEPLSGDSLWTEVPEQEARPEGRAPEGLQPAPRTTGLQSRECAQAIVGALMGAYDGRRGWIYHLAVAPDRQREGIGRALMAEIEVAMARIGVEKINLQVRTGNLGVIGFYERLGYGDDQVMGMGKWINRKSE